MEPTDDGGVRVIRPIAVLLPNCEPDSWTDMNCAPAYDALADGWHWLESDVAEPSICGTELTRAEFFEWLATRGKWLPTFWGDSSPGEQMVNSPERRAAFAWTGK
jgi:hypothetical protein